MLSALIIFSVSELSKRFTTVAAVIASLPLVSILALIWLYHDTKDIQKIIGLSTSIFWAVLPSLLFFIILPFLLKTGMKFGWAMILSSFVMFIAYTIYIFILSKFGIKL
ncbi:MAG: hypothetical protein A2479_02365 [Candidatus Magasanikbacteria bacterium RIFOXYC2_FULL_39_8]|nr:MAG: hypothetical protein A2479_02365 [Candidatus Magasanikbacteria bacterium RIFOXYC2_FULL_39_8]